MRELGGERPGVGREVYVNGKNVAAGTLSLSQGLYGGAGTRAYTFTRYRYAFDFSDMESLSRLNFADIEFLLDGNASAVMLASCWLICGLSRTAPPPRV